MSVNEKNDSVKYAGKRYYFCCAECRMAFENNPEQFIKDDL